MLPSARLFLNENDVYQQRRAQQRAKWLYAYVERQVDAAGELVHDHEYEPRKLEKPFPPRRWRRSQWRDTTELVTPREWYLVAKVAQSYPRLLTWLSEGQVGFFWNVFGLWVSVLRVIPGVRWLLWLLIFKRVAVVAPWRVALYSAILQQKRYETNTSVDAPVGTKVISRSSLPGLSAVTEEFAVLTTYALKDLQARIAAMSSGCIGISGLRGAGKSTLIEAFCADRYGTLRGPNQPDELRDPNEPDDKHPLPGLRIMVRAPLRFEPRDFLIHQYTCLCRAVLADVRFNPTTLARQLVLPFTPGRIRLGALIGPLSGAAFLAGCAVLAYLAAGGTWPRLPEDLTSWEIAGAVVAGLAGMAAVGWRTKAAAREIKQVVNLASDAEERLTRLHYQRTDARSAGGTFNAAPAGISVGTSHELTQQMMSLPELIDDYRDFVQRVVGGLKQAEAARRARAPRKEARPCPAPGDAEADVRLVIGIDQLDQIDDPGAACRFLDELSAEFGTPNCVYLLAVAARTMAAADRRTVPLKTSSAGLFDEMIWVEPLSFAESAKLLSHRVIGLPPGLIALCYVLSGGLPRELLRIARSVVRAAPISLDTASVPEVADIVIKDEIRALKHRALASAATDANGVLGLVEKLTDRHWPWDTTCPGLAPDLATVLGDAAIPPSPLVLAHGRAEATDFAADVCDNFLAGVYFLLTVHELFKEGRFVGEIAAATQPADLTSWGAYGQTAGFDVPAGLAGASIALGINPRMAVDLVTEARRALGARQVTVPFARHHPRAAYDQPVGNGSR
jgi:hypothetical protein